MVVAQTVVCCTLNDQMVVVSCPASVAVLHPLASLRCLFSAKADFEVLGSVVAYAMWWYVTHFMICRLWVQALLGSVCCILWQGTSAKADFEVLGSMYIFVKIVVCLALHVLQVVCSSSAWVSVLYLGQKLSLRYLEA